MEVLEEKVVVRLTVKDGLVKEYSVGLPTIEQDMAIDGLKLTLSQGKYKEMAESGLKKFADNLDRIDAAATFSVLITDLHKDYGFTSLGSLSMKQGKELVKQFNDVYEPYYNKAMKELDVV